MGLCNHPGCDSYVCFPPAVAQWIKNLNIGNYPGLYEDERAISAILLKAFLSNEQIEELNTELEACSSDERGQLLLEYIGNLGEGIDAIELPKTPAAQKFAEKQFLAMSDEERQDAVEFTQRFFMGMLAGSPKAPASHIPPITRKRGRIHTLSLLGEDCALSLLGQDCALMSWWQ